MATYKPKKAKEKSFRIQSKCGKIRTRKTPNTDTFHAVTSKIFDRALTSPLIFRYIIFCKSQNLFNKRFFPGKYVPEKLQIRTQLKTKLIVDPLIIFVRKFHHVYLAVS